MSELEKRSGLLGASAECLTCDWSAEGRNAIGIAAQHAKRYGHEVMAEQYIGVSWRYW